MMSVVASRGTVSGMGARGGSDAATAASPQTVMAIGTSMSSLHTVSVSLHCRGRLPHEEHLGGRKAPVWWDTSMLGSAENPRQAVVPCMGGITFSIYTLQDRVRCSHRGADGCRFDMRPRPGRPDPQPRVTLCQRNQIQYATPVFLPAVAICRRAGALRGDHARANG